MAKKALVFLAEGFEEVEAVTPIDYLRRAGVELTVAAVGGTVNGGEHRIVSGAHGISIRADTSIDDLEKAGLLRAALWDGAAVPGGMPGAAHLAACTALGAFYREMAGAGKITAALCASPALFLAPLGLLQGRRFTCYPGMETKVSGGIFCTDPVVQDGSIITSRGPGTAGAFALALIAALAGEEKAAQLKEAALL